MTGLRAASGVGAETAVSDALGVSLPEPHPAALKPSAIIIGIRYVLLNVTGLILQEFLFRRFNHET